MPPASTICRRPPWIGPAAILGWAVAVLMLAPGCSKPKPPPIVAASGTITLGGEPLPSVRVRFIPMFEGFGAELEAEGLADDAGKFTLTCSGSSGACVGIHRVVVEEGPLPPGASGESGAAQMKMTRYLQGLKNRPIPDVYKNVAETPLEVEIREGQGSVELKLTRK